ncbi:nicotinamide-nucleotide amidohydrolase family protein [Streptomyces sp. WAC04770]|nr:nicotinamide-nucleotide amidohydrolase family protein [Streptomyces sp. WAC04770]RST21804.1 nicotinamide-nucleotide amidohydrolase family protein [Streptomyces sp. WAC04770]
MCIRDRADGLSRRGQWTLLLLSAASGAADAFVFLSVGQVFAGVMTGNLVLLGASAAGAGEDGVAVRVVTALTAYACGAASGALMARLPLAVVLLVEAVLLGAAAVLWGFGLVPSYGDRLGLLALVSLAMGIQGRARVTPTNYFTGTLTSLAGRAAARELGPGDGWVLGRLVERGETLAVAESLTGGLVAADLTSVPGASRSFRGSLTAYATALKGEILGVDGTLLAERGAVDPEVARQMAAGVRRALGADWGIATTGVAGPEPQDGQPVGTVYVAVAGPSGVEKVSALRLNGSRADIRRESVRSVLELLASELGGNVRAQDTEQTGGN